MESYNLQLIPGGVPLVLHASQYDGARDYKFTPLYGSAEYGYQSGAKVYAEATKPDKTVVQEAVTYNTDGTIYYKPSEVLFQAAGDVRLKIVIADSNNYTLASAAVTLAVDLAGITTYAQISASDLSLLHTTAQKISTIDISVEEAQAQATRAKSWAVGPSGSGTDGTDTNNSKYWSTQSANSATAAANSASAAKTSETNAAASKTAAASSQSAAKTSETNAAASKTAAASSQSAAKTSETNAKTSETNAANSASAAKTSETNAATSAKTAESWAVGGTGSRSGEDTNNAKYWAKQAETTVTGVVSLNGNSGKITLAIDESTGDISITVG